ncbi:7-methylguanosine phosphate-specific 5'-nucleotidase [Desmophyllum pertusum]|uniref:5'-nucleotidase n=1 Tax=Desmophyllum pertusum TaxID=174260 RepID=A0A9W9ZN77_9CNID|nr:7-methylguanosine phosphate-specific 5'-nucleotidase [Desmophyllum pertusum]
MFGIAAVGLSAVAGYGVYKYVQGKQNARKIKEAVDEMIKNIDKPNVYIRDSVGVREKLSYSMREDLKSCRSSQTLIRHSQNLSSMEKKAAQCMVVIESCKLFPESYRETAKELKEKYMPIEFSGELSSEEKLPHMVEWWTKGNELITELKLKQSQIPEIVKDAHIALRDGVEWFFVKLHEKNVPLLIISGGLGDVIKEVIDQQSTMYDNVNIVANFFKFEQVRFK